MKTLDEKAAEYAASVVSRNKEAKECEGLIQTAYVLGAMKGELLGRHWNHLNGDILLLVKDGMVRECLYLCDLKIVCRLT